MKLITWNVQWCCGLDGRVDVARIVQGAREMADFDVLCLQEVADHYPDLPGDASHDQPALLRRLLPGFEVCFGAAVDELAPDGSGRQRFGNMVATRLPVLQVQHFALPWPTEDGLPGMPRLAVCATLRAPWGRPLRVTTTHLEYYSRGARLAQAQALSALNAQATALAGCPPQTEGTIGPFRAKPHTADAIFTGDFNFEPDSEEYLALTRPAGDAPPLIDAWRQVHGARVHDPTFRLHDRSYGPNPVACDFVFASGGIAPRLRHVEVNLATKASDHQPVLVELGG